MRLKFLAGHICLILASATATAIAAPPVFDLGNDVSAYQRYLIYPHLSKGFSALEKGQGAVAIAEFVRARDLAPKNADTALYLADAYRRFGQVDKAEAVLAGQFRYTPADPRVSAALSSHRAKTAALAKPHIAAKPVDCARDRGAACRTQVGHDALRAGRLSVVEAQLDNQDFAASANGIALRRGLVQRAIYLREWKRADEQLSRLDRDQLMTQAEREQWFNVKLLQGTPAKALKLQSAGGLDGPAQQLALAQALARNGDTKALAGYLANRQPEFADIRDEKQWITLMARASEASPLLLARYRTRFPANRQAVARLAFPAVLASRDVATARRLLDPLPACAMRQERFDLAIASGQLEEARRQANELAKSRDMGLLDSLSYRMIEAGGGAHAARLLIDSYPFEKRGELLTARLTALISKQPELVTPSDRVRLHQPLGSTSLRASQAILFAAIKDCEGVLKVLGDLDPGYDADRWTQLGDCYQKTKPGLAEYAYAEAARRRHSDAASRSVAYQAFANKNFSSALAAWRAIPRASLTSSDAIAAARTSLAATEDSTLDWLDLYASRGGVLDDSYWWLRAQAKLVDDPGAAEVDVERAIAARPDAQYFAFLAKLQSDAGRHTEAISSLEQAIALQPGDDAAHAALGYAYWREGDAEKAREQFQIAHAAHPEDVALTLQLVYANQRLGDREQARRYVRVVVDAMEHDDDVAAPGRFDSQRHSLRRLHEDLGRRWRFSADLLLGTDAAPAADSIDPATSYSSYSQVQLDYRVGGPFTTADPEALVAYGRIFAGSGESGNVWPFRSPVLGVGLRWKPFASQVVYLAVEHQLPFGDVAARQSDTLLRASASFLGNGRFNDDWNPSKLSWMTQNIYLDAAYYLRRQQTDLTASYRIGRHWLIAPGQTIEPYGRLQYNMSRRAGVSGSLRDVRTGLGLRWNYWSGQNGYDAYRHRINVGLEWQHAVDTYLVDKNAVFIILGGVW
ncbi:MAG: tetratricopeptide repeat protein [Thermomonas sp.]